MGDEPLLRERRVVTIKAEQTKLFFGALRGRRPDMEREERESTRMIEKNRGRFCTKQMGTDS